MDIGIFSSPRTVDEFVATARSVAHDGFGSFWTSQIFGLDAPAATRTDLDIDVSTLIDGHDLKVQLSGGPAYLPMHHLWEGVVQVQVQAAF